MHIEKFIGREGTSQIIKRTTYPLISWAPHRIAEADRYPEAADGHRASSDLRLQARAPDPAGRSDLVA